MTTKRPGLTPVPLGVVTLISPLRAPLGTAVKMLVLLRTWKLAALPPNVTEEAPEKFLPLIVTAVPTRPLLGENPVITGVFGCCVIARKATQSEDVGGPPRRA